jgi:hypothetical protein
MHAKKINAEKCLFFFLVDFVCSKRLRLFFARRDQLSKPKNKASHKGGPWG